MKAILIFLATFGVLPIAAQTGTLRLTLAGGTGGGATLVITDNGHGIPPAIAKSLFTPFFSTKPQGQGLGLLLIRDILTSHHCTFNLLTDPEDHLTRFTIQFPIQKAAFSRDATM